MRVSKSKCNQLHFLFCHFRYTYEVAPAFTLIELKILSHILELFGIPDGDGIFSPGGSISMLYAMMAARYKAFPQVKSKGMRSLPGLVVFTSEDVSKLCVFYILYDEKSSRGFHLVRYF